MARITKQFVKKMVTEKPVARIVWDDKVSGFCVRQTEAGTISYVFDYYMKNERHRLTIGRSPAWSADDARKKAEDLRRDVDNEIDPKKARDERESAPTLKMLADEYIKDAEGRKRESSLYDDRRMLNKIILPTLGKKRLDEVTNPDIARLRASLRATPYQANRVLALLSSIFNYGIKHKWNTENPAKGSEKFEEKKRRCFLSVEQIQRFREALDEYKDQSAANVLRLLLLTGSRASEARKATWEEFDLQRGVWTKPSLHTKQKTEEDVPLSAPALRLLEGMYYEGARGPLFPSEDSDSGHRESLKRPWIAACRAAGLVEEYIIDGKRKGKDGEPVKLKRYRPMVRVHDLRHNFASHLASNGVSLQVVGKLLGHTQIATTMRYAHLQDAPLRDATNQFGRIFTDTPKAGKRRA